MKKKNEAGSITPPDIRSCYVATAIETVWYWQRDRCIHQWNRVGNPEINPHKYAQLCFSTKMQKRFNGGRSDSSANGAETVDSHGEKGMNLDLGLSLSTEINSK